MIKVPSFWLRKNSDESQPSSPKPQKSVRSRVFTARFESLETRVFILRSYCIRRWTGSAAQCLRIVRAGRRWRHPSVHNTVRTVRVVHSSRCNGSPGCYSDRGRSSGKSRDHLRSEAFKTNLIGEQLFYAKINVLKHSIRPLLHSFVLTTWGHLIENVNYYHSY